MSQANRDPTYLLRMLESIEKTILYATEFLDPISFFEANDQNGRIDRFELELAKASFYYRNIKFDEII